MQVAKQVLWMMLGWLVLAQPVWADTLAIQVQPDRADTNFVRFAGHYYAMANLEDFLVEGTYTLPGSSSAEDGVYVLIEPEGSVRAFFSVPSAGTYTLWLRLRQYGNSSPTVSLELDGSSVGQLRGGGWKNRSFFLSAGPHSLWLTEDSGEEYRGWPYAYCGIDIMALTDNSNYDPPNELTADPLEPSNTHYARVAADCSNITVQAGGQAAHFSSTNGSWNAGALLLLDDLGAAQATVPFDSFGADWAGWNLSQVGVTSTATLATRFISGRTLNVVTPTLITPNNDGLDDRSILSVSPGATGTVTRFNGVSTCVLNTSNWNGVDHSGEPAPTHGYLIFSDAPGSSTVCGVFSNPDAPALLIPRVLAFSPNGDDVYDTIEVTLTNGLTLQSGDTLGVLNQQGQLIRNLPTDNPVVWDGRRNDLQPAPTGTYRIAVLDQELAPRLATTIERIDLPPTTDDPWEPDFFPLGVWYLGKRPIEDACADIEAHGGNALFGITAAVSATNDLDIAWDHGLRVLLNMTPLIHGPHILGAETAPSELELIELLGPIVEALSSHPAMLGYYIADEPGWNDERAYRLRAVQQTLARLDSDHPAVMVLIGLDGRMQYVDVLKPKVLFLDLYPKRDFDDDHSTHEPGNYTSIYGYANTTMLDYLDQYIERMGERKAPVWIVHQAHSFDHLDEPIPEELGLQAWLSLTRGVRGYFYFAYETDQLWTGLVSEAPGYLESDRWQALGNEFPRFSAQSNLFLNWTPTQTVVSIQGGGNPYGYERGELGAMTDGTNTYLIAVNRNATQTSQIQLASSPDPEAMVRDLETGQRRLLQQSFELAPGDASILLLEPPEPDTVPPSDPTGLRCTQTNAWGLMLQWTASTDNVSVARYHVARDGIALGETTHTGWHDRGLRPETIYRYSVTAEDVAGLVSTGAAEVEVSTPWQPAPAIPTNGLRLHLNSEIGVSYDADGFLQWLDQSGNAAHAGRRWEWPVPVHSPTPAVASTNEYTVIRFDGANNLLGVDLDPTGWEEMTVVMVAHCRGALANKSDGMGRKQHVALWWGSSNYQDSVVWAGPSLTNAVCSFGGMTHEMQYTFPAARGAGQPALLFATHDHGTQQLFVDGLLCAERDGAPVRIPACEPQNPQYPEDGSGYLGAGQVTSGFPGDLSDLLVYDRRLGDSERDALLASLYRRRMDTNRYRRIRSESGPYGAIIPSNAWTAADGEAVHFAMTPAPYSYLTGLTFNGQAIAPATQWVWTVTNDLLLEANFALQRTDLGVPHAWLASHGITDHFDALQFDDPDHDRMATWQEWIAGCNPTQRISRFTLHNAYLAPDDALAVEWQANEDRSYMLYHAPSPSGPFTPISEVTTFPSNRFGLPRQQLGTQGFLRIGAQVSDSP